MNAKYYVIAYVKCSRCNGTKRTIIKDGILVRGRIVDKGQVRTCLDCNEQGEVEVRVPLVEALNELGR